MKTLTVFNSEYKEQTKKAFHVAWPAVMESFFVAFIGIVDSFMVSSLGAYAVAAIGLTNQPKFIAMSLFFATNLSVSALVARRKGEGDQKGANQILLMAAMFSLLTVLFVSVASVVFANEIIHLSGSEADTHESAVAYFQIITGAMIFQVISMFINAAQRGSGNTKVAMKTNITSNVVNLIGNYLLIGGNFGFPALGVRGAAIATIIGSIVACGMSIASIMKKESYISIFLIVREKVKPAIAPAKNMVKIASTVLLEFLLIRIGFMSVAIMSAKLGTNSFAAHQLGMNIMGLSFSFGEGMQVAAVALIGQSLGQNKKELANIYGKICRQMGMMIALVLSFIYFLFGESLYRLFFVEEEIIAMGIQIIRMIIMIVILQIAQVIYMGSLRAAGDVKFTTAASTISVTIIRPIASYLLCYTFGFGIMGIWMGVLLDQVSRFVLTALRYKQGKWMHIKI